SCWSRSSAARRERPGPRAPGPRRESAVPPRTGSPPGRSRARARSEVLAEEGQSLLPGDLGGVDPVGVPLVAEGVAARAPDDLHAEVPAEGGQSLPDRFALAAGDLPVPLSVEQHDPRLPVPRRGGPLPAAPAR